MKWPIKSINEWLITISIFIGVVYLFGMFGFNRGSVYMMPETIQYLFNPHPTSNLLRTESLDAISIFRGMEPKGFEINMITVSMLCNIILYFLIGPFLLYLGYKNDLEGKFKSWYWFVGMVICLGSITIVPIELVDIKVFENTKESAEETRIIDSMKQELLDVGFATAEHLILNKSEGNSFNLEYIEIDSFNYDYTIEGKQSDSLITIICTNPEQTTFSVKLEVYPDKEEVMRMRN